MKAKRLIFINFLFSLSLMGYSQWKELPLDLFYNCKNSKFLTTQKDSLVIKNYPDFELYEVDVKVDSFLYNPSLKSFRIVGKTTFYGSQGGIPIEILKRNGILIKTFKKIGESARFNGKENQVGLFDVSFELQPQESILFYLGGAIHQEFNLNRLYHDKKFLQIIFPSQSVRNE